MTNKTLLIYSTYGLNIMAEKKIRKIYQILSKEYLTFAENNND